MTMRNSRHHRLRTLAQQITSQDVVLDIGAYDCALRDRVQCKEYHAVDLTPFKEGVLPVNVSYEKLPYPDQKFDVVVMSMLLSHVDNPVFTLQEARRVLKDSGKLLLVFTNIENINKVLQGIFHRKKYLTKPNLSYISVYGTEEIVNLLTRTGFTISTLQKQYAELLGYHLPFLDWTTLFSEYILVVARKSASTTPGWRYGGVSK